MTGIQILRLIQNVVFLYQSDGIEDWNITLYQVDLRVANSERLPDLWLPVTELAKGYEDRLFVHVPGSPKSHIYVIGNGFNSCYFCPTTCASYALGEKM